MRVVITGASGTIGMVATRALESRHDLVLIDRRPSPGRAVIRRDLSLYLRHDRWAPDPWPRWWRDAFRRADVVVHLAAWSRPNGRWWRVRRHNIQATWNVFDAAAHYGVARVVFASSLWSVKAAEQELAPACYEAGGPKLDASVPPRPLTEYGVSKAFGEIAGRELVDRGRLRSFMAVRIGYCARSGAAYQPELEARRRWIGHVDIASLLTSCVEVPFEGSQTVYGVSGQPEAPVSHARALQLLDWAPVERSRQVP